MFGRVVRMSLSLCLVGCTGGGEPPREGVQPESVRTQSDPVIDVPPAAVDLDESLAVVEIRVRGGMPVGMLPSAETEPRPPDILVLIRGDGEALWSVAESGVGSPFRRGRVEPDRLRAWLADRVAAGTFDDPNLARARVGPDAACTSIELRAGVREFRTCSWFTRTSANDVVVTANGIEPRDGRDPDAVFAAQPADFRTYVEHFETVVAGARALLPPGEAVTDSEAIALVERTE